MSTLLQNFGSAYEKRLNSLIFFAILLGAAIGFLAPQLGVSVAFLGEVFIRLLTILIVPVIVISMIAGILNLDDSGSLGRLGLKSLIYYSCTTAIAVFIGLLMVNIVNPGTEGEPLQIVGTEQATETSKEVKKGGIGEVIRKIIPKNVVRAAQEGNVLGLIFFSIFLAAALMSIEHAGVKYIRSSVGALFEAIIWMVNKVMLVAPIGIFALVANLVGDFVLQDRLSQLGASIGMYSLTVAAGLLVHGLIALPLLAMLYGINVLRFAGAMFPALTTAFSTASSAATLPITIDSLEQRAGVSNKTASFVAPLGATVNMDGTAIYEAVAAVFIANMYGFDLTMSQQLMIFLTATFSAVGAAGIPGAGLIMMTLVLDSVGLPAEGIMLIVVVDRFLDMMRTCINVWGDSIGSAIIAKSEGEQLFSGREVA